MFNSISKKINLLMAKEGISGMQLARKLGIPPSTIKKIRSQEITNPTVATLAPIAKYFSVSLEYLLEATDDFNHSAPRQYCDVPLINWEEALQLHTTSSDRADGTNIFALSIETDDEAMLPLDSFIIVDSTASPIHCDFVIIAQKEYHRAALKQFLSIDGKNYLRSSNNIESLTSEHYLLATVKEYHKNLKICNTAKYLAMENKKC